MRNPLTTTREKLAHIHKDPAQPAPKKERKKETKEPCVKIRTTRSEESEGLITWKINALEGCKDLLWPESARDKPLLG